MILKCAVYRITNLISGKIYIGSTADIIEREKVHFRELRRGAHKNSHLQNAFSLCGESSFVFEVLEHIDIECNHKREVKEYIEGREQYYLDTLLFASEKDNRFNKLGYNNRRKAATNIGLKQPPEAVAAMILRNTGKKRSKKRYSIASKAMWSDPEKVARRKKKITTQEEKDRKSLLHGKPVLQYDLQGNFIAEYHASAVAVKQTGIKSVKQCCLGYYTKAEDFVFIYRVDFEKLSKEEFNQKIIIANQTHAGGANARAVNQIDKETFNIINTFHSATEAARHLGKDNLHNNISRTCLGKLQSSCGFKWQYV